ncbi:MAG: 4-hydroxythreonine-4-phosphate dehydrogenase PdxA [Halieaceae bacterium]|jgi:4-hydroxythreonine-4-phosphate dehydrogenase|nr:4-hydroxythreonine-4-phosphate dehydrogenase PdxA [Halieaceae bacterium]
MSRPRIAISAGDPAGIGPDIVLAVAAGDWPAELVVIADADMLKARAEQLGLSASVLERISIEHEPLAAPAVPGEGDTRNAAAVLEALRRSVAGCQSGDYDALVTAPVNKAVIADSGVPFSGHTEFLAELTNTPRVVMLLAAGDLRVALATTHLPLRDVPVAVERAPLEEILRVLDSDLKAKFGLAAPRISVLGLNPHAGEGGHLGHEDEAVIAPAIAVARAAGIEASGPWPADTAFNATLRTNTDAYLAMYHDQGLPVLKYASFGAAVNITLGLPIIRTSVDHGTAFDLAGTGKADPSSLRAALTMAIELAEKRRGS